MDFTTNANASDKIMYCDSTDTLVVGAASTLDNADGTNFDSNTVYAWTHSSTGATTVITDAMLTGAATNEVTVDVSTLDND